MSPCFTTIMLLRMWVTVPTVNLILTFLRRDFKMVIILGGKPNISRIIQRRSRGTLPNVLTKSGKIIQVSLQCSLRFFIASFTANTASVQPLAGRNLLWDSWSSFSAIGTRREWTIFAMIL